MDLFEEDQSILLSVFNSCDTDDNAVINLQELFSSSQKYSDYFGLPDLNQAYYRKFVKQYWHLIDKDNSGSLNLDEYKNRVAAWAVVDAVLILEV